MWDSKTIYEKVTNSADKYGFNSPQQLKQLIFSLNKCIPQDVYDALITVFLNDTENSTNRQKLAGRLLYAVKPEAIFDVKNVIEKSLEFYELSVEELPYYFVSQIGLDLVISEVGKISEELLSENQSTALSTIKFWLRKYEQFSGHHS